MYGIVSRTQTRKWISQSRFIVPITELAQSKDNKYACTQLSMGISDYLRTVSIVHITEVSPTKYKMSAYTQLSTRISHKRFLSANNYIIINE